MVNQARPEEPPQQIPFPAQQLPQSPFPSAEGWPRMPSSEAAPQANVQAAWTSSSSSPSEAAPQANAQAAWTSSSSSPPVSYPTNNLPTRPEPLLARKPYSSAQSSAKRTRMGFTIAGLCIIAGSLLLVFVYLIEQGVLPGGRTTTLSAIQPSSTARLDQTAIVTQTPPSSTPATTPTPTLPGQDLLDTSVLSSSFNEQTGQILQQSTDFKVNQKIYVIFSLHPGGNSHLVCLDWYLNDLSVNKLAFQVNPAYNYKYYSFAFMSTSGKGHVDISLASTTTCTDAILAQKLSFTVS
jgi:hypothetical protein